MHVTVVQMHVSFLLVTNIPELRIIMICLGQAKIISEISFEVNEIGIDLSIIWYI